MLRTGESSARRSCAIATWRPRGSRRTSRNGTERIRVSPRLLIVDDQDDIRLMLQILLRTRVGTPSRRRRASRPSGWRPARPLRCPDRGLQDARPRRLELARQLREKGFERPIILCSAYLNPEVSGEAQEPGGQHREQERPAAARWRRSGARSGHRRRCGRPSSLALVAHELKAPDRRDHRARRHAVGPGASSLTDAQIDDCLDRIGRQGDRLDSAGRPTCSTSLRSSPRSFRGEPRAGRPGSSRRSGRSTSAPVAARQVRASWTSPSPLWAVADPDRLEQVLVNLLTNAYRYGGSTIRAGGARRRPTESVVTVADDGDGVPG